MNRAQRRAAAAQGPDFQECKSEDIARAIVLCETAGQVGLAELFREMRKGGLALITGIKRARSVTPAELDRTRVPTVILIGDDDYASTGPDGWRSAASVAGWARWALIHAAAADRDSYREAAVAARVMGRAAIIETSAAYAEAWGNLLRDKPALVVLPRGGAHPVMRARELVH